jgi:hypothetical protein
MITPRAAEPMVEMSLASSDQTPVSFWIAASGVKTLTACEQVSS